MRGKDHSTYCLWNAHCTIHGPPLPQALGMYRHVSFVTVQQRMSYAGGLPCVFRKNLYNKDVQLHVKRDETNSCLWINDLLRVILKRAYTDG